MDKEDLMKLIEEDDLGLLDIKPSTSSSGSQDETILQKFIEINEFLDHFEGEPDLNAQDQLERGVAQRLEQILKNPQWWDFLKSYDRHHLLKISETKVYHSLEEIYSDDELGLFNDDDDQNIFTLTHVSKGVTPPDYVGRIKPCDDFENFEQLFIDCQNDLKCGNRLLSPFTKEESIKKGNFFVCGGVLYYIENMEKPRRINGRKQSRLRCILENGKESDILNRSLAKNLYNNGKIVSPNLNEEINRINGITTEDKITGYIYILESESRDARVRAIKNLYKIGYCETTVQERIKNAESETTYLMAPVRITEIYQTYNMDTQKLEFLLHKFFDTARVSIDVNDIHGSRHTVREWFQIPLGVIKDAILKLINQDIVNYAYDRNTQSIVRLKKK